MVVDGEHLNQSRSDAEERAAEWLKELVAGGNQDWKSSTATSVECLPVPELPCRVFSFSEPTREGFAPCFGLIAGRKSRGPFWQYTAVDPDTGHPLSPAVALKEIETIIGVLIPAALASVPGPAA